MTQNPAVELVTIQSSPRLEVPAIRISYEGQTSFTEAPLAGYLIQLPGPTPETLFVPTPGWIADRFLEYRSHDGKPLQLEMAVCHVAVQMVMMTHKEGSPYSVSERMVMMTHEDGLALPESMYVTPERGWYQPSGIPFLLIDGAALFRPTEAFLLSALNYRRDWQTAAMTREDIKLLMDWLEGMNTLATRFCNLRPKSL